MSKQFTQVTATERGEADSPSPTVVSAHWDSGSPRPKQPYFASAEDQLLALTARYEALECLLREVEDTEEETGESMEFDKAGTASRHILRMKREIHVLINGVRATNIRELGLKARIAFDRQDEAWRGDGVLSDAEEALQSLVLDVMVAAGVTIIPTQDLSAERLRQRAKEGRWGFEPVAAEQKAAAR